MEYRQLGKFGVRVSPLCLGAMNFGGRGRTTKEDGVKIIHAALDAGVNFIDTANVYTAGESERVVGEALKGSLRDDVVLATKVFSQIGQGTNDRGTSRFAIMREVDRSLERLQTDRIDLYQLHRWDAATPLDEIFRALDDLVRAGKVRYVGVSTFPAWVLAKAQGVCERMGFVPIATEQPPYNLLEREIEKELLPACRDFGMGVIPWSPLAGGWLSGKYRKGEPLPDSPRAQRAPARFDPSVPTNARKYDLVEELSTVAAEPARAVRLAARRAWSVDEVIEEMRRASEAQLSRLRSLDEVG